MIPAYMPGSAQIISPLYSTPCTVSVDSFLKSERCGGALILRSGTVLFFCRFSYGQAPISTLKMIMVRLLSNTLVTVQWQLFLYAFFSSQKKSLAWFILAPREVQSDFLSIEKMVYCNIFYMRFFHHIKVTSAYFVNLETHVQ